MARHPARLVTLGSLGSAKLLDPERSGQRQALVNRVSLAIMDLGFTQPIGLVDGLPAVGMTRLRALADLEFFTCARPHGVTLMGNTWMVPVIDLDDLTALELEHLVLCDLRLLHYGGQLWDQGRRPY